ncbi:MAG: cyclic nucleotide-binding and patatin-like phospholipase domain-containing protein [Candidatus Parabeggiatoa sp.]|nr:cyclic nucleotide-binding and patatin-like phospholipase domain-containing protein [Candidatus Parabeggiatoa sp.]
MKSFNSQLSDQDLFAKLKTTYLFENLTEEILNSLSLDFTQIVLSKGETLIQEGGVSNALYIVLKGRLKATLKKGDNELVLSEIGAGGIVGELQMLIGGKHTANVTAINDTQLLKLSKTCFEKWVEQSPDMLQKMADVITPRLRRSQLMAILPNYFGASDETIRREIEAQLEWVHLQRGEALFRQFDAGDSLYIVVSGRLQAIIEQGETNEHVIGEISQGESVGEMALFAGQNRTASVYALRDCDLVKLSQSAFEQIIKQNPRVMMEITQNLITRLQKRLKSSAVQSTAINIAIIPLSSEVPLTDFCSRLISALSAFDATLHLNSERLDNLMGLTGAAQLSPNQPQSIRLVTWLDEQALKHRFILYQADMPITSWTKWCLRRADQIILVADATDNAMHEEIKAALQHAENLTTDASKRLVLLHPNGEQLPSNTLQWLSMWPVKNHHHIRWNTEADFQRLARFLSGRAIGLVFSGGGARGLAHFGVYLALKEAGIPIDMMGGTSMGGIVAAQCAADYDTQTFLKLNKQAAFNKPFKKYTLPIFSLVDGKRFENSLKMGFGEIQMEDLWTPFFCVSSNLTTSELVVHKQGCVWKALRASAAIPGMLEPVVKNGHLLVDGGVVNNLPGDIMRQFCHKVIVVDVSRDTHLSMSMNDEKMPSPWEVFWSRLLPYKKTIRVPSLINILMGVTVLSSNQRSNKVKADADFYLHPPVEQFGLLEFEAVEELIEVGYQYTKKEIENWNQNDLNE